MTTLIVHTDDTINGGIAKITRELLSGISGSREFLIGRDSRIGYPPLYFFNVSKLYRNMCDCRTVFINDPQCSTITVLICFLNLFFHRKVYFLSHGFLFHNTKWTYLKTAYFKMSLWLLQAFKFEIVSVSPLDSKRLIENNIMDFIEIFNGVDFSGEIKKRSTRDYKYLCVSRNVPHKRIGLFIEFCQKYCGPNRKGLLVTDRNLLIDCDYLDVLSEIDDHALKKAFLSAEIFISFSTYEGFGLAALEAVSNGCSPLLFKNQSFSVIFKDFPCCIFEDSCIDEVFLKSVSIDSILDFKRLRSSMRLKYSRECMLDSYKRLVK